MRAMFRLGLPPGPPASDNWAMKPNPYESPQTEPPMQSRTAFVFLVLGVVCCLMVWSTRIFPSVGPMINRMDGLRVPLLLYFWVQNWAAVIGPVFTGIAMWKGSSVIRAVGVFVLLVQAPDALGTALWMLGIW